MYWTESFGEIRYTCGQLAQIRIFSRFATEDVWTNAMEIHDPQDAFLVERELYGDSLVAVCRMIFEDF